jgi:UTP-glucose-1-phosphate uridylyltransferase
VAGFEWRQALPSLPVLDWGARYDRATFVSDGIAALMRREKVFAFRYEGRRYDCGSKEGFLEANVELALMHPQLGPGFRSYLKSLEL